MQISISQARQNLPQLVNRVFNGEEFVITKNKIPAALLTVADKKQKKKTFKRRILPKTTYLFSHLKGETIKIANNLRTYSWKGTYDT